jgi:hypothetical protein
MLILTRHIYEIYVAHYLIALNSFTPQGLSGETIIFWKSSRFIGRVVFQNDFAMSVEFISTMSGAS